MPFNYYSNTQRLIVAAYPLFSSGYDRNTLRETLATLKVYGVAEAITWVYYLLRIP